MQLLAFHDVLTALVQMAFDHQASNALVTRCDLCGHVSGHIDLAAVLLAAVGVRQVHHDLRAQAAFLQQLACSLHMGGVVIGRLATAQDDVAVLVATGLEDGALAHLGHAHKGMAGLRSKNRITGHLHATVCSVFEAHRAAQATGQLAVALALGRAGTNRAPADQVADELWRQQIQKLRAHRQAQRQHIQQQATGQLQPFVDGKAAVAVRVVDIALPAHRGAWLFKVHAHHDQQIILERIGLRFELARIFHGLVVIVNRAWPHHHHQPVVLPVQHARNRGATGLDQRMRFFGHRQPFFQQSGSQQRAHDLDARVINTGLVEGGQFGSGRHSLARCRCSRGKRGGVHPPIVALPQPLSGQPRYSPPDSFISTSPLTIKTAAPMRMGVTDSPSTVIPTANAPTAPIPVQIV